MLVCIIIFGIWCNLIIICLKFHLHLHCVFYFICIDSAFFLCRINYRRHSREYDDQRMKEKFATFVPFITFVPIANVVVYTTNAVCTCSTSPSSSARLSQAIVIEPPPRTLEAVINNALGS